MLQSAGSRLGLVANPNQRFEVRISLLFFWRDREGKLIRIFFLNDSIQDWFANQRWFANLLLNKKLWIFDSRIINDSQIFLDSRIIVDSNQDSNQILNWFTTHESEIFDSRQAIVQIGLEAAKVLSNRSQSGCPFGWQTPFKCFERPNLLRSRRSKLTFKRICSRN